jgi:hypothetical protein
LANVIPMALFSFWILGGKMFDWQIGALPEVPV